jgi:predicted phage terminase large subunit-like protein
MAELQSPDQEPQQRSGVPPHQYTSEHANLFLGALYQQARNDFGVFRRIIRPNMQWGWWPDESARELQQFHADLSAGKRPIVAIQAPSQHGKSEGVNDFIAWCAGNNPDLNIIYASYSDELGTRANRTLQRTISSEPFSKIFPLQIGTPGWAANNNLIEFVGHSGSFRNTTVEGQITGLPVDLGIIDDPLKGRAEANSRSVRDKIWAWFTDDFYTRLSKNAGVLIIMTRWHVDDLVGRVLQRFGDEVRVLRYAALAEEDENHWMSDWQLTPQGWVPAWKLVRRLKGEPLFPELKPKSLLLEQQNCLSQGSWESQYQQNPIIVGGGQLPIEQLKVLHSIDRANIRSSVRYWDKGASYNKDAAYTAGVLMHKMTDNTFVIEHVVRRRWNAFEREQRIREYAEADKKHGCKNYKIFVEQEPGSAGQESVENTIRNLAGFQVYADKVTGSKQVRAEPFTAQVQAGNVFLRAGPWVEAFRDECETWPNGKYKDQIDAAAGAFNRLIKPTSYDFTYAGFN